MHRHEDEQLTYILEEALHIPSNLLHKAEALEDTLDVNIFDPPRRDRLSKTDGSLHG